MEGRQLPSLGEPIKSFFFPLFCLPFSVHCLPFRFFSFLITVGIVFGIAAIPTIPVSLVFLPCDTKTFSIAGIAVFIISGSLIQQNSIFEEYTNLYFKLIIDSNFYEFCAFKDIWNIIDLCFDEKLIFSFLVHKCEHSIVTSAFPIKLIVSIETSTIME